MKCIKWIRNVLRNVTGILKRFSDGGKKREKTPKGSRLILKMHIRAWRNESGYKVFNEFSVLYFWLKQNRNQLEMQTLSHNFILALHLGSNLSGKSFKNNNFRFNFLVNGYKIKFSNRVIPILYKEIWTFLERVF